MTKNDVEFLIGWCDFPLDKDNTWEPITNLPGSEQKFPRLDRMTSQYLTVSTTFVSPERLFNSVGLAKSDLWGTLLDRTLIDVMWAKQAPRTQLVRDQQE